MSILEPELKRRKENPTEHFEEEYKENDETKVYEKILVDQVVQKIGEYLEIADILALERVNKAWRSSTVVIWKRKRSIDFHQLLIEMHNLQINAKYPRSIKNVILEKPKALLMKRKITNHGLEWLCLKSPMLKAIQNPLTLYNSKEPILPVVLKSFEFFRNLRELDLSGKLLSNSIALPQLFRAIGSRLEKLNLAYVLDAQDFTGDEITNVERQTAMFSILRECFLSLKSIKWLDFSTKTIDPLPLDASVFSYLPNSEILEYLCFTGWKLLPLDCSLANVFARTSHLRHLGFSLGLNIEGLPKLTSVALTCHCSDPSASNCDYKNLSTFETSQIEKLHLSHRCLGIPDKFPNSSGLEWNSLVSLHLSIFASDRPIWRLETLKSLRDLELNIINIVLDFRQSKHFLPRNLESLKLNVSSSQQYKTEVLDGLSVLDRLSALEMRGVILSDNDLVQLLAKHGERLRRLSLIGGTFSDVGLRKIATVCSKLEHFGLALASRRRVKVKENTVFFTREKNPITNFSTSGLQSVINGCTNLRSLAIGPEIVECIKEVEDSLSFSTNIRFDFLSQQFPTK